MYKYDAFISYRHSDLDKYVAENIHKLLETYKLPEEIKTKYGIEQDSLERVFRDQEELPLSSNLEDSIITALKNSKFLIVICSPRLKESMWCKREIETFVKFHGRENVFCVLVEGEPSESFPENLLYEDVEKTKNGKKVIERVCYEPLALDVRASSKGEVYKKIKGDIIRLIAPMFSLNYDDLKQRHKEREMRRRIKILTSACIFFLVFSFIIGLMSFKIISQSNEIKKDQAINLSKEAFNYLNNDDRSSAIEISYEALTKHKKNKMPYTDEAMYALTESLGVYENGYSIEAISDYKFDAVVADMKISNDYNKVLVYDKSKQLTLIDLVNKKIIGKYDDVQEASTNNNTYTFYNDNYFAYINIDKKVVIRNVDNGEVVSTIDNLSPIGISGTNDDSCLFVVAYKKIYAYKNNEKIFEQSAPDKKKFSYKIFKDGDNKYFNVYATEESFEVKDESPSNIYTYSVNDNKLISSYNLNTDYIEGIVYKKNNAYILANKSANGKYTFYVASINLLDGKENYKKAIEGGWGSRIQRSYAEGTNTLVVTTGSMVYLLNMDNGNELTSISYGTKAVGLFANVNSDIYTIFTKNGEGHILNGEKKTDLIISNLYKFNISSYESFLVSNIGYIAIPTNENRIVIYNRFDYNGDKVDYEEEKANYMSNQELNDIINEYNLDKKNLINSIIYNDDNSLMFITYFDSTMSIYDTNKRSILNTVQLDGDSIDKYLGKTKEGNILIAGVNNGYMLSKNYNIIARIPSLKKYNSEDNTIIIKSNKDYYKYNILTKNEILSKAKDYLNK